MYVITIFLLFSSLVPFQSFASEHTENMVEIARFQLPLPGPEIPGGIHNTTYAAQLVNCTVTNPGEVFSFNKTVGPRTLSRGFVWSESIGWTGRGYARIKDVGGGVCRTSTAIHQAVVKAGLTVLERHSHSIPVEYAASGDDAAVWYDTWDYKFRNNKSNPITIKTFIIDGQLVVVLKELNPFTLLVDGDPVVVNAIPFFYDGKIMVPVRSVLEKFKANLYWDQDKETLRVIYEDSVIELNTNLDETDLVLIKNNIMYMPARALAAILNCQVDWNSEVNTIHYKKIRDEPQI